MPGCNAGPVPTAQGSTSAACSSYCQRNSGRIFRCQNFLSCTHKGDLAHCLTVLGCYISQEDPCTPSRGICLQPCPWLMDGTCCCHPQFCWPVKGLCVSAQQGPSWLHSSQRSSHSPKSGPGGGTQKPIITRTQHT